MPWPLSVASWTARIAPRQLTLFNNVSRLKFDALAGNVAVIHATSGLEPGTAAVAHASQDVFVPTITNHDGELSIKAYPSLFSFTSQNARISTIVFTPADLESMNVTMKLGEAWVFQCPSSTADHFAGSSTLECRVQVTAGDCHVVDLHAAKIIEARNVLGDVKLSFDDDRSENESRSYGDDSNSTILGDVKIFIGGRDHGHALPATAMREKWMSGTGKDFS
jgi:hypothetical protein